MAAKREKERNEKKKKKRTFCPPKGSTIAATAGPYRANSPSINQCAETAESNPPSIILPPCASTSASLSASLLLIIFLFFWCTTRLSRRRCIDSSAPIRSTIYAATVPPAPLVFLSTCLSFSRLPSTSLPPSLSRFALAVFSLFSFFFPFLPRP